MALSAMAEVYCDVMDAVVVYNGEVFVGGMGQHAELARGVVEVDAEAESLKVGALEVSASLEPFL